jgi:hypothetical protein
MKLKGSVRIRDIRSLPDKRIEIVSAHGVLPLKRAFIVDVCPAAAGEVDAVNPDIWSISMLRKMLNGRMITLGPEYFIKE